MYWYACGRMQWQRDIMCCPSIRSRYSSVAIITRLRAVRLRNPGSVPGRGKIFFFGSLSDRLSGPLTLRRIRCVPGLFSLALSWRLVDYCRGWQWMRQHRHSPIYVDLTFTLHYTGGIEKSHEHQVGYAVPAPRFDLMPARIRSRTADQTLRTRAQLHNPKYSSV